MIFALCSNSCTIESGSFTYGRLYPFDRDHDKTHDDHGKEVRISTDNQQFAFPERVCATVVKPFRHQMVGNTVVVTEKQDDFLYVCDEGYQQASRFQLLDLTVVRPGMIVYDTHRLCWDEVTNVLPQMQLRTKERDEHRTFLCFDFAVRNGKVADYPLVECINNAGRGGLTLGKTYRPLRYEDMALVIEDDTGTEQLLDPARFKFV